jgi:hypothetical protein
MKKIGSLVLSLALVTILSATLTCAQEKPPILLVLSKDAIGSLAGGSLTLTLRANTSGDEASEAFPDGSQLVATDLNFVMGDSRLGLVSGSLQIKTPGEQGLQPIQTMTLRGTFGLNVRRDADKGYRIEHLEALLESVPTFAPVNAPQIAMAHLSADLIAEAAAPIPIYRAKLDGVVTLPLTMDKSITINPDKTTYKTNDAITVVLANNTDQAVSTYDLKSYCSIVRLQRQDADQWEDVGECMMKRRSFPITIPAGETRRITLTPDEILGTANKPGTYRLVFDYVVGTDADKANDWLQIVSPAFPVN